MLDKKKIISEHMKELAKKSHAVIKKKDPDHYKKMNAASQKARRKKD